MAHTARLPHPNDRPKHGHTVSTDQVAAFIEMDRRKAGSDWDGSRSTGGETRAASGGPRGAAVGSQPTERAAGLTAPLGGLRGDSQDDNQPTPEMVRQRIRRSAVVPSTISVPCIEHSAAVGTPCYRGAVIGVCWQRVVARAAKR